MPQIRKASRESVYQALFNLCKTCPTPTGQPWGVTSRKLVHWSQVEPADQPAFFQHQLPQDASQPNLALAQWKYHSTIWIYYQADACRNPDEVPDTTLNNFLDNFEKTIDPIPGEKQTLGRLPGVLHCHIDGTIYFDAGLEDQQAVIVIPIVVILGV